MPFDLMSGFQAGQQLGEGQSAFGVIVKQLTARANAIMEQQMKSQAELQTQKALIPLKAASAKELLQEKAQLFPPQPKNLSGDTAGRLSLASQGQGQAATAKRLLFPSGTPESFNRGLVARMHSPFGIGMIGNQESQSLEFNLKRALDAQLRSETGAAVSPGELDRLTKEFIANAVANPRAAFERITSLESGLRKTSSFIDPTGHYRRGVTSPFEPAGEDLSSMSDEDILRGAGLAD